MIRAAVLCLALSGCAILGSKEMSVGCQAADGISTALALKAGLTEANPLLAGLGLPGIFAVKFIVAFLLVHYADEIGLTATATINTVTCGAAVRNLTLL